MSNPDVDVTPTGEEAVFPKLPASNAHLAPVRPVLESEGVATTSATGQPVIPPKAVPYIAGAVAVATVVHEMVANPTVQLVTAIIVAVGAVLGIASPGLRRKP